MKNNRIQLLTEQVTHMIAAGEVIEGAHSVIKELVENSIDASSDSIVISAEESGFKKISVKDNGCGIFRDDLALAVKEHATSKIVSIEDISTIRTLGFRGEAISSIASISDMTILTRRKEESFGGRIEIKNEREEVSDYAGPAGTTVIVENLFYNVPARKKFLKSVQGESRAIRETVLRAALGAHEIAFALELNGKKALQFDRTSDKAERVKQFFGEDEYKNLSHESVSDIAVKIDGFVSRPHAMKSSRSYQYLFVNGRPVEMRSFSFILSKAYESAAPMGTFPAAVLYIEINPDLVDVNIHPSKKEIKFFDQHYVESLIVSLVKKTLSGRGQFITAADLPAKNESGTVYPQNSFVEERVSAYAFDRPRVNEEERVVFKTNENYRPEPGLFRKEAESFTPIGIAFGTYIISQKDDELSFIDFHAAHERIIFDSLMSNPGEVHTQQLAFPVSIVFSPADCVATEELLPVLNGRGFDVELFSDDSIIARGVPTDIADISVEEFIRDFVRNYREGSISRDTADREITARIACHSARRANDKLSVEEIHVLASTALSGLHELTCPHGRPYLYTMRKSEIEKLFRR